MGKDRATRGYHSTTIIIQVETVNMESGEYIAAFSTVSHHPCICRTNWSEISKTKRHECCFVSILILMGSLQGKKTTTISCLCVP